MPTDTPMQLGMIGLGRMGANLVRRLMRDGHRCVAYDRNPDVVKSLAGEGATGSESSEQKLERDQVLALIDAEIQKLPARQREAFLMRYWEDMDVAETAAAMGCSEGSVKTHCSRATHTLAVALKAKGITL